MKRTLTFIFSLALVLAGINVFAQKDALKPEVIHPVYFDISPPLRDMVKIAPEKADNSLKVIKNYFNVLKDRDKTTFPSDWVDPSVQHTRLRMTPTQDSTILNFLGNSNSQGYDPPDTYGQVGLNNYFQVVNCHFSIYDKSGNLLMGPTSNNTIWNGMPNNYNGGDGVVLYDAQADRWMFSQLSYTSTNNWEMIAVSQTNDPTGSWYRYEYAFNNVLPDYPKFGVWPDGYYMAVNRFTSSYIGTEQCVFDRTAMINGDATAQMVSFTLPSSNPAFGLLPSDCDGAFPPVGTPNYYVYMDGSTHLGVYEFHVDWTNTANSTFGNNLLLTVNTFNKNVSNIHQKGTSVLAEVLSDRLMYRLQFRQFGDHWSMVTNHTVNAGNNIAGIRWYELRKAGSNPWGVYQQSTYAPPDTTSRWMGSIAMDSSGNIGLGFSISSSKMYPAIKYTGRLKNDSLNTLDLPEKGIFYGAGSNTTSDGGGYSRWGDYSSMTIDPSDGMTFWYTQQYNTSMGSGWKTRIATFSFANLLSMSIVATPDTICQGDSTHLNVLPTGGSGTYTYSWTSDPTGFTSTISNPVVAPSITTTYIVAVNDGSTTVTDSIAVIVNSKATANAGPNASYPNTTPLFPVSGTATSYSSVKWITAGDGQFNIDTVLSSVYTPGALDRHDGGVLLSLLAFPLTPCIDTVTDTVFIKLTFPLGVTSGVTVPLTVNIIPNPSSGLFNCIVHGAGEMNLNMTITDIEGKTIFSNQDVSHATDYSKMIDLSGYPKGIYTLKLQTDLQTITKKIVIQ